jgi:hypothetical protein
VILSNTLGAYYCSQEPNPKTYIKHTVEEPISIYWEDNIYPGFDEADSKLMVANYLDGVHLQMMALNTPEGKVKVYSYANVPQSYIDLCNESETVKKEMIVKQKVFNQARNHKKLEDYPPDFNQIRDMYLKVMDKNEAITKQIESARSKLDLVITETTRDQMPQMNYTVKTDEVHLSDLARTVLYSDEVKITDNRTKEVIAYNRDVMQLYSAKFLPDATGEKYVNSHDKFCGEGTNLFERGIFTSLKRGKYRIMPLYEKLTKTRQK